MGAESVKRVVRGEVIYSLGSVWDLEMGLVKSRIFRLPSNYLQNSLKLNLSLSTPDRHNKPSILH
jgi:hypothetical protein